MLLDHSQLRSGANRSLEQADRPDRVILLHTGIVLLLSLLLTLADHLLDQQIGTTGGLSGMGLRSFLETVQSILRLTQTLILPFWQIGYTSYTLRVARGQSAGPSDLLEGFRRFGPVLRLKILIAGMTFLLIFVSAYVGSFLFMMTPWATPLMQEMEDLVGSTTDTQAILESFTTLASDAMIPSLIIFFLCFLAGGIFLFFRFRLAELWLMDHPGSGALASLRNSKKLMRGNWKAMFRVDLGFWWFYLLDLLVSALCYGDVILDALGVEMAMDAFGGYLLFFCIYLLAQLALYWWKRNEVSVTYAHAYVALCPENTN